MTTLSVKINYSTYSTNSACNTDAIANGKIGMIKGLKSGKIMQPPHHAPLTVS